MDSMKNELSENLIGKRSSTHYVSDQIAEGPRKFRKKPVVIEAFQWFPHLGEVGGVVYWPPGDIGRKPVIESREGQMEVSAGDWIITGIKGERYPCKPDIFKETYEPE